MLISNRPIGDQHANMHALKGPIFNYRHGGGGGGRVGGFWGGGHMVFRGERRGISRRQHNGELKQSGRQRQRKHRSKNEFLP